MLTIFLPIRTTSGVDTAINPQQIASIEAVLDKPDSECIVRMAINLAQQDQDSGQWMIGHCVYIVGESKESLLGRISVAQQQAQQSWWGGAKELQKALNADDDDQDFS